MPGSCRDAWLLAACLSAATGCWVSEDERCEWGPCTSGTPENAVNSDTANSWSADTATGQDDGGPWIEVYEENFTGSPGGFEPGDCSGGGCPYYDVGTWWLPSNWHQLISPEIPYGDADDWSIRFRVYMDSWDSLSIYADSTEPCFPVHPECPSAFLYISGDEVFIGSDGSWGSSIIRWSGSLDGLQGGSSSMLVRLQSVKSTGQTCAFVNGEQLICADGATNVPEFFHFGLSDNSTSNALGTFDSVTAHIR